MPAIRRRNLRTSSGTDAAAKLFAEADKDQDEGTSQEEAAAGTYCGVVQTRGRAPQEGCFFDDRIVAELIVHLLK